MKEINKIVDVGMSKTGTSTLAACLEILSTGLHKSFDRELKESVIDQQNKDQALKYAENYKSFEDSPWYHLYQEMDQHFPGSKFILTVRKDSYSHAKSSWFHGVQTGSRTGEPTEEYLQEKIKIYEDHNNAVRHYFKNRPDDLLVLCWEKGDNWPELCNFLGVDIPTQPFPHANAGNYKKLRSTLVKKIKNSSPYTLYLKLRYWLVQQKVIRYILDLLK